MVEVKEQRSTNFIWQSSDWVLGSLKLLSITFSRFFFCPRLVPTLLWWSLKCGKMGSKLKTARISVVHESTFCRKFKQNVSMVENYNLFSSLVRNANKTCDFLMSVSAKGSRQKKLFKIWFSGTYQKNSTMSKIHQKDFEDSKPQQQLFSPSDELTKKGMSMYNYHFLVMPSF